VVEALDRFLHPLTGGAGDGWPFGRAPHRSELFALIEATAGVDHVDSLTIEAEPPFAQLDVDTRRRCLIWSGAHRVSVAGVARTDATGTEASPANATPDRSATGQAQSGTR
jgi:hypothetical protein